MAAKVVEKREISTSRDGRLPNLLLGTTYALNKSNSKRVTVGLKWSMGEFQPVVRLATSSLSAYISFDKNTWEELKAFYEVITAFFQGSYRYQHEYGSPSKLYSSSHELIFQSSYSTKSILIEEKPVIQQFLKEKSYEEDEPSKKKKSIYFKPLQTCLQQVTFDGLRQVSPIIDEHLNQLEGYGRKATQIYGLIVRRMEDIIDKEPVKFNQMFKSSGGFEQYYDIYSNDVNVFVAERMLNSIEQSLFDIIMLELRGYFLPDICATMEINAYEKADEMLKEKEQNDNKN